MRRNDITAETSSLFIESCEATTSPIKIRLISYDNLTTATTAVAGVGVVYFTNLVEPYYKRGTSHATLFSSYSDAVRTSSAAD